MMRTQPRLFLAWLLAVAAAAPPGAQSQDGFSFRGGVELINVTAQVTDGRGRSVSGLREEDFAVFEDGEQQEVTCFSNDRVPVSLGILLDASGSMTRDKMSAARSENPTSHSDAVSLSRPRSPPSPPAAHRGRRRVPRTDHGTRECRRIE